MTKDKLLNINSTPNEGKMFIPTKKYFTFNDLVKLQRFLSTTFTNFDGGFGMVRDDEYDLSQIAKDISFRFTIPHEKREEVISRKWNTRWGGFYPDFKWSAYNCIETLTWLETIVMLCEDHKIAFRYDPNIIDEIISFATKEIKKSLH